MLGEFDCSSGVVFDSYCGVDGFSFWFCRLCWDVAELLYWCWLTSGLPSWEAV